MFTEIDGIQLTTWGLIWDIMAIMATPWDTDGKIIR
jgi:hypothetical protein